MMQVGQRVHSSLNIVDGPAVSIALFQFDAGQSDQALICLHHHVIDGYSTHLVVGALLSVYQDLVAGREPQIPTPSCNYRDYLLGLHSYMHQPMFVVRALAFWRTAQ